MPSTTTTITTTPILTDAEAAHFRRTRLRRRAALLLLCVSIPALLFLLGRPVYNHLHATFWLRVLGANIEWAIDRDTWHRGGVTSASLYSARADLRDADLKLLKSLRNLEALDLSQCDAISDSGLSTLRELTDLKSLDLSRDRPLLPGEDPQPRLTDAALTPVATLPRLTHLTLAGNRVTDAGPVRLARLEHLEYLDLSETLVTDAGLDPLKNLKRLKCLKVAHTKVTPAGALALERALPGLEIIFEPDPPMSP